MTYLDAIFYETMRMYDPAHQTFYRSVREDYYLEEILIKKGTVVAPFFFGLHYD